MLWEYTTRTALIVPFRMVHVRIYLQRGEDAGDRSSEQEEDRDGRELARVSVPEVGGGLYQLGETVQVFISLMVCAV